MMCAMTKDKQKYQNLFKMQNPTIEEENKVVVNKNQPQDNAKLRVLKKEIKRVKEI